MKLNKYGLTFRRWLAAAGRKADKATRQAWETGEDPADWAVDVFGQIKRVHKRLVRAVSGR